MEKELDVITAILLHQLKQYDSLIVFCYLSFIRCLGKNSQKLVLLAVFFNFYKMKVHTFNMLFSNDATEQISGLKNIVL